MDKHSFLQYLSDYNSLNEVDSRVLQELTERFPFCQNLHFLRCKKGQLAAVENYPALLSKAATYSTDRTFLFKKLHEEEWISGVAAEAVIEVPYDTGTPVLEDIAETVVPPKETQEDSLIAKTLSDMKVAKGSVAEAERVDEMEQDEQLTSFSGLMLHNIDYLSDQDDLRETVQMESGVPVPKTQFKSYLESRLGIAVEGLLSINESEVEANRIRFEERWQKDEEKRKRKEAVRKETEELIQYAESSLVEKQDSATETLARLLAMQGHKDKAIAMYEKLKLQIPEKSTYFAAQIEKLKIS